MSESSEERQRGEMILEAIDALRGRKARPDESRICQWLERRYGLTKDQILGDIRHSVSQGLVLKVKYKDSISYRNPAKFNRIAFDELKTNLPLNATKRVLRTIRQLTLNKCSSSQTKGASMCRIMSSLHSNKQMLSYDEMSLERILKRAMQAGTVDQLPNGSYVLAAAKTAKSKKRKTCATPTMSATASSNSNDSCDVENAQTSDCAKSVVKKKATQRIVKRGRPVSTRKKFKKSLGPDFLEPSDLGLQYLQDTFEPKYEDCQSTDIDSETIDADENDEVADGCGESAKRDAKDLVSKDRKQMIINTIRQISDSKTCVPTDSTELQSEITLSPGEWTVEDVFMFICSVGFPDEALAFREQCIDGVSLMLLTRMDVLTGLSMKLGPALKIYGHIKKLQYFCSQQE